MPKAKINQTTIERCLLTEVLPYETPILFSNWGSYNFCRKLHKASPPPYLSALFRGDKFSIPYKFKIKKDQSSQRTLSVCHPKHSNNIVDFYKRFGGAVLQACRKSAFSLRAPHHVAKFYTKPGGKITDGKHVEDITAETAYASSYFAYRRFSHLHKFFNSDDFTELEKRFAQMFYVDIAKCFPSLYTHSISWAIRGKTRAKQTLPKKLPFEQKRFDDAFDSLLQQVNYQETNGIVIGPEISRIFAEVILQKVDTIVMQTLAKNGVVAEKHYACARYIDDYFFFFNDEQHRVHFFKILREELEKFKLYINDEKCFTAKRPFISDVSVKKIELSEFLRQLAERLDKVRASESYREINRLRTITKDGDIQFSAISSFLLSSIAKRIRRLSPEKNGRYADALYIYLDLAFHAFRMDVRVASSYRIANIVLDALAKIKLCSKHDRQNLLDKIVFEMRGAVESAVFEGSVVETLNLLLVYSELGGSHPLPTTIIKELIAVAKALHNDEYSRKGRLSYFEIVSLLYFFGDKAEFIAAKASILDEAETIIRELDPLKYAESAYLLLDLVSCPYLAKEKDSLIAAAMSHDLANPPTAASVIAFREFASKHDWYFHWNRRGDLRTHLKKKQLLLSY